ncbi:MAG: CBS domain-containing protein [Candidatus Nitrohelix vancouverensis]|uniref:CBS domain-containing protein n=1 Tax=Candidatus Nitrohelix vancouverensis TaxID=2705534 RepID=A0A7T0G3Z9_9BACT|nr:MAG: CBS domain-containing protein [Candidatus Nitrohelix vancouverensis]
MDKIKTYMNKNVVSVDHTATVMETVQLMAERNIGSAVVMKNGALVGIFTETDLLKKIVAVEAHPERIGVERVMSEKIYTEDLNASMAAALVKMEQHDIRHLVILDGKDLIGMLSIRDLVRYIVGKFSLKKE